MNRKNTATETSKSERQKTQRPSILLAAGFALIAAVLVSWLFTVLDAVEKQLT